MKAAPFKAKARRQLNCPSIPPSTTATIAAGITSVVLWEGKWDQRLKYRTELPKGKTIGLFQSSNLFKVKKVVGDTMCIVGGMPVTMLVGAEPDEIRAHTRRICEVARKGYGAG